MHHIRKAFAYITNAGRLLVFRQPQSPEAGIQVPAGTIEEGESPEAGVMREAYEETGLEGLRLVAFLGERIRDVRDFGVDEIHHRYFYHLEYEGDSPELWQHFEISPCDGREEPIEFELFWAAFPDQIPELIADHDAFFSELAGSLHL